MTFFVDVGIVCTVGANKGLVPLHTSLATNSVIFNRNMRPNSPLKRYHNLTYQFMKEEI